MACNARGTVNPGMERDAPQAWQRGSPEADHAPKATPEWTRPGGGGSTKAVGFMPRRARHRERRAAPPGMWTGTDAGTEAEGPARGSRNNRSLNAAINPSNSVMPSGRRRDGRVQEEVVPQGPLASRQGHPGSVPKRKHRTHLRGRQREPGMELDKRRPQAPGVEAGITGT